MNRRKACSLSAAFLLGIAAMEYSVGLLWWALVFYGAAWLYAIGKEYRSRRKALVCWLLAFAAAASLGCFRSGAAAAKRSRYEPFFKDGEECLIQGTVYERKKNGESRLFYLKSCKMQLHQKEYSCQRILLDLSAEGIMIGEILCVKGTVRTFKVGANEGNYNEKAYYQSQKIDVRVDGKELLFKRGKKNAFLEGLAALKERLSASYEDAMTSSDAGVLTAMTAGDKSCMEKSRKLLYQKAGISHFYSISGLHISMLASAFFGLLRKLGCSYFFAGTTAGTLLLCYGCMIGFGVSAVRAIGMFLLLLYAKYRGRSYDRLTALFLLAAALAIDNPSLVRHAGYLLSFGAVAGVIAAESFLPRKTSDEKKNRWAGILTGIRETVMVSVCIQLFTIPVSCAFFYEISVYSVLANLVVLPCMGAFLAIGLLGGAAGCIAPRLGAFLLYPCSRILLLFDAVCSLILKLPGASFITGSLGIDTIFFWYLSLFAILFLRKYKKKPPFLFLFLPLCFLFGTGKAPFEIDVLDVGQGDGIFFSMGDGTTAFIDGGSSSVAGVGEYRILPFLKYKGVRKVDYWFVSHCDEDHVSGLLEIIEEGYPIGTLVVSAYMQEDEAWLSLRALADKKGIPVLQMKYQDGLLGAGGAWSIRCLSLEPREIAADRNENSLALFFENEYLTGFFAGDIGEEQERRLVQEHALKEFTVYKASHHGSNGSSSKLFLEKGQPKVALISCGAKNRYGHPGEETLKRLREAEVKVYETRFLGQIKIKANLEAGGFRVLKYNHEDNRRRYQE